MKIFKNACYTCVYYDPLTDKCVSGTDECCYPEALPELDPPLQDD